MLKAGGMGYNINLFLKHAPRFKHATSSQQKPIVLVVTCALSIDWLSEIRQFERQ
jgi:hypothetical protein